MNYILECDSFNPKRLGQWLAEQNDQNVFYVLHKKRSTEKFKATLEKATNAIGIVYEDLFTYSENEHPVRIDFERFNKHYFADGMPFFFLDRDGYFPNYGQGNHNAMVYYLSRVPYIVGFLIEKEIKCIYFRNTPHHSIEWLVAKSAEYWGVDVIISQRHILPWRYSLVKGFGRFRIPIDFETSQDRLENNSFEIKHIEEFIKMNLKDYQRALPSYEKNRMSKSQTRLLNPFKQWRELLTRPPHFFAKYAAYKSYNALVEDIDLGKRFVVFFLHYQPERTTLPEGYGFQNQLLAITELRNSLPNDIFIYVKEHPSMFTNTWHPKARNKQFYHLLLELHNVVLVKLTYDTFKLIDNALAVATVTGTVGIQAYIRNTPVIFFGFSVFKAVGVHIYSDSKSLQAFVFQLINREIKIENVELGFRKALSGSVSGILQKAKGDIDYHSFTTYQEEAHFKLLTYYFHQVNEQ